MKILDKITPTFFHTFSDCNNPLTVGIIIERNHVVYCAMEGGSEKKLRKILNLKHKPLVDAMYLVGYSRGIVLDCPDQDNDLDYDYSPCGIFSIGEFLGFDLYDKFGLEFIENFGFENCSVDAIINFTEELVQLERKIIYETI